MIDEEALEQALSAAVTCTILAAAGPQRSRVLATLYKVMAFLVFFLMKKIKILQLKKQKFKSKYKKYLGMNILVMHTNGAQKRY